MNLFHASLLFVWFLLSAALCAETPSATVAALVGGKVITAGEVEARVREISREGPLHARLSAFTRNGREKVLDQMIRQELFFRRRVKPV